MLLPMRLRSSTALFLALALSAGCATPGHVKAVKTATRLENLSAALEELRASVAETSASLNALVASKADPKLAFDRFEDSVPALEKALRRADNQVHGVRQEADAYFVTWKEQAATIDDEDLKDRSEERRNELAAAVDDVEESMKPVRESIEVYLPSLRDTLKYLSIDLTPSAISSIEGRAKAATKSTKSIEEDVNHALETAKKSAPQFAAAGAATPRKSAAPVDKPAN